MLVVVAQWGSVSPNCSKKKNKNCQLGSSEHASTTAAPVVDEPFVANHPVSLKPKKGVLKFMPPAVKAPIGDFVTITNNSDTEVIITYPDGMDDNLAPGGELTVVIVDEDYYGTYVATDSKGVLKPGGLIICG